MTTVKLDSDDDELLEILRAKMIIRGKKMAKKDILGDSVKKASRVESIFHDDNIDNSVPLEEDHFWIILNNPAKLGLKDTSVNVDDCLY